MADQQIQSVQPSSPSPNPTEGETKGSVKEAGYDSKTRISSLADLKEKAPKVWEAMLLSIAQTICMNMDRANDRLKKLMREGRQR